MTCPPAKKATKYECSYKCQDHQYYPSIDDTVFQKTVEKLLKIYATNNLIAKNVYMGKNEQMYAHKRSYTQPLYHELTENNVDDANYIQDVEDIIIIHICRPKNIWLRDRTLQGMINRNNNVLHIHNTIIIEITFPTYKTNIFYKSIWKISL